MPYANCRHCTKTASGSQCVHLPALCSFKFSLYFPLPAPLSFCLFLPTSLFTSLPLPSSLCASEVSYPNSSKLSVYTCARAADFHSFSACPSPYVSPCLSLRHTAICAHLIYIHSNKYTESGQFRRTVSKLLSVELLLPIQLHIHCA